MRIGLDGANIMLNEKFYGAQCTADLWRMAQQSRSSYLGSWFRSLSLKSLPYTITKSEPRTASVRLAMAFLVLTIVAGAPHAALGAGSDLQKFNDGLLAYIAHETPNALTLLRPLAEEGDPLAQMLVARLYAQDEGTDDCGEAVKWFIRAAEQGNAEAQFELGGFYIHGQCVLKNDRLALRWLELSAQRGESRAPNAIGEIYLGTAYIPRNYTTAIGWFLRGAKLLHADAFYNLGVLSALGQGAPKDYVEAYKWFALSAQFLGPAGDRDKAIRARDVIREAMTPAQVTQAQRRAEAWTK